MRKNDDSNTNDDLEVLPWWKKIVTSFTMAVPSSVSFAETSEGSIIATLAYMASKRNLDLISVWSPTFALNMLEQMRDHRYELAEILSKGDWCGWKKELSFIPCPKSKTSSLLLKNWDGNLTSDFFEKLWLGMALISSWATSTSKFWADELMKLFPKAIFMGKGLWATEGVITFCFEGKYPLAVTSHFYEFMDMDSGKIFPAWKLENGQILKPLLSTGSGLFRYTMNDKMKVVDFAGNCPCFEFLGRLEGVDMVDVPGNSAGNNKFNEP
jgi:GH3 auxin-responsive promoter.